MSRLFGLLEAERHCGALWLLRAVAVTLLLFLPASHGVAQQTALINKRVALIVGNDKYTVFPRLNNAVRDAAAVKKALLDAGWKESEIIYRENLSVADLPSTLQKFREMMHANGAAFLYYAGHGVQDDGKNYLLAVDAKVGAPSDLHLMSISVSHVVQQLEESSNLVNIVVLDACRTKIDDSLMGRKPGGGRTAGNVYSRGLARIAISEKSSNPVYLVYATQPDRIAQDGPAGANSPFTGVLVKHLGRSDVRADVMFSQVLAEVVDRTGQLGDISGWLRHDFAFASPVRNAGGAGPSPLAATPVAGTATTGAGSARMVDDEQYERSDDGVALVRTALKTRSIEDIRRTADANDAEASYLYGVARWLGVSVAADAVEGRAYLKRAADLGFRRAAFAYAGLLWNGVGGPTDQKVALEMWQASAKQRFIPSMLRMARYWSEDAPPSARNYELARKLYEEVAPSNPDALAHLAEFSLQGLGQAANVESGLAQLREASKKGSRTALVRLAHFHRFGIYVDKMPLQASRYYAQAAEAGSLSAMEELGAMLLSGEEVPPDKQTAVRWLQKAADTYSRRSESLLVKAYVEDASLMPPGWPLEERALTAAQSGYIDGLVKLAAAYKDGAKGVPKSAEAAERLASRGLALIKSASADSDMAWPMNAYSLSKVRMHLAQTRQVAGLSAAELAEFGQRWGSTDTLKRVTVPITCGKQRQTFHVYVWDSTLPGTSPVQGQFTWLRQARDCSVSDEIPAAFEKLYALALENKVSFADLTIYALNNASRPSPAETSSTAGSTEGVRGPVAASAGGKLDAAGLQTHLLAIASYERVKRQQAARMGFGIAREELAGRFEHALQGESVAVDPLKGTCTNVKALSEERSKKAGEAAQVIRLALHCSDKADAILLLPDDVQREAVLYVDSRPAGQPGAPSYVTRYYISRSLGVTKSLHDLDGDGKPDTFGVHVGGQAEFAKALPLSGAAL